MENSLRRVFDVIDYQLNNFPKEDSLACKIDGQWKKYSTQDFKNTVDEVSKGLIAMGIEPGDKVAIISQNRPEWLFVDYGVQQIGAIGIPMYPTITAEDYEYIFNESEVKMVFTGNVEIYQKAKQASLNSASVEKIYCFDSGSSLPYWDEVRELGSKQDTDLQPYKDNIKYEDLVTIIYTSGTTGTPKGVMLSHRNLLSNSESVSKVFPSNLDAPTSKSLSFLPLCHIFERTASITYIYMGISVYFAESLELIGDNMREIKPELFTCVPRLLEKVYDKIIDKGRSLTGIKKSLFFWAVNVGAKYEPHLNFGPWYNFKLKMANKLIFSKWREALGGNVRFIISGAAALQPRLSRIFWSAQIPVLEGYGLTETSPGICFSRMEEMRVGCVGLTLDNVEVKIAEDGEILARGPNIMMGYFKKPELTAEVIEPEGWFHTGDIGEFVEGRFLKITDRKKEMFKTSGGKYIAPQLIENKFKESLLIEQMMVVGEGQKHPSALIVPSFEGLKKWCEIRGIDYTSDEEMVSKDAIIEKYQNEIEQYNENFAQFEKIKKFKLLGIQWNVESGELTPTLKLKRKIIHSNYKEHIDGFYQ